MPDYNAILGEFAKEIQRLVTQRDQITQRINALVQAMESVKVAAQETEEPIVAPPPLADEEGFTNKIRNLLKMNPARSFTPVEIRNVLAEFDRGADQRILLIHTHNTVKRLHRQGEVDEVPRDEGKAYRWKHKSFGARIAEVGSLTPGEAKKLMEPFKPKK